MANLLVPIILIISSVGLFFTYLSPAYDTLKAFQAQDDRIDDALDKFQQVITKKDELTRQYVSFGQSELDGLKLLVSDKVDVVQTVLILDKLAQENNLYVDSFSVPDVQQSTSARRNPNEPPQEYGTATFRVSMTGTYENLKKFLYQLERSLILMDVAEFTIEPAEEGAGQDTYTFSIAFNTYWFY